MQWVIRFFPPTIHPMVVHFPIAIGFLLLLAEVAARLRPGDPLFRRAGLVLYVFELLALVAAAAAGVISERYAAPTAGVPQLLEAHKRDAILTGLAFSASFLARLAAGRRRAKMRGGPTLVSLALLVLGVVLLSITGSLGGTMVYDHGFGVAAKAPAARAPATRPQRSAGAGGDPLAASGRRLWLESCQYCHGDPPPFGGSLVQSFGEQNLTSFIATTMPPGNPVGVAAAKAIVSYLKQLP
jgi:uncharacterized membrane protein